MLEVLTIWNDINGVVAIKAGMVKVWTLTTTFVTPVVTWILKTPNPSLAIGRDGGSDKFCLLV
jgi:hypothetical protein